MMDLPGDNFSGDSPPGEESESQRGHEDKAELPLKGWTVLIPRTPEQAAPMVKLLHEQGADTCVFPTIAIRPPKNPQDLNRAIQRAAQGKYEWIIFTSHNAVEAVARSPYFSPEKILHAGTRIAAVGEATAQSLARYGLPTHLTPPPEKRRAAGLVACFAPLAPRASTASFTPSSVCEMEPSHILLPRADIAKVDLIEGLEKQGWEVEAITAYRTTQADPPSSELRSALNKVNLICFTSASTVRHYCSLVGVPPSEIIIACIGPIAAAEARKYGLNVHIIPDHSGIPELITAVAEYARQYPLPRNCGEETI